jgi:hypothetical protein
MASYYASVMPVQYDLINDEIGLCANKLEHDDIGLIIRLFEQPCRLSRLRRHQSDHRYARQWRGTKLG